MTTDGAGNTLAPLPASILTQGPNLIVSIHTALDDEQLVRLQRDLLDRVGSQRCRGILIDVAALDVLDSFAAHTLGNLAYMARLRGAHDSLHQADVAATPLASDAYGLVTLVLADEHLPSLMPVYREAARLLMPGGSFLLVGYHSFFIMQGMPTHFHRADGAALTIESHVHLFADHFAAGQASRLVLTAMDECVIDEAWLASKPKWRKYLGWPVSFSLVLRKSV